MIFIGNQASGRDLSRTEQPWQKKSVLHLFSRLWQSTDSSHGNKAEKVTWITFSRLVHDPFKWFILPLICGLSRTRMVLLFFEMGKSYTPRPQCIFTGYVTVEDNSVLDQITLYKHVFPPKLAPGLSFIGLPVLNFRRMYGGFETC